MIDGEWVTVGAGALVGTPENSKGLGSPGVWLWYQTEGERVFYPAPGTPKPPLRIDAAKGTTVILFSDDGVTLRFDAIKRRYV